MTRNLLLTVRMKRNDASLVLTTPASTNSDEVEWIGRGLVAAQFPEWEYCGTEWEE